MSNNQTDIFSMFNLVDEYAEEKRKQEEAEKKKKQVEAEIQKKKAEEENAKFMADLKEKSRAAQGSSNSTASEPPKETVKEDLFDINEQTIIRHFGESIEITSYFSPDEIAEGILVNKKGEKVRVPIEKDMLRKRMEKEFPELVKEHTDVIYERKKNIVFLPMKAKKKGCSEENLSVERFSINRVAAKIPYELLEEFVSVAKKLANESLEIHADIYYNFQEEKFFLDFPFQRVHKYWVEVTEKVESIVDRVGDSAKVMEIHSHHNMLAIPSSLDNESERVPGMVYGIVGEVNNFFPAVMTRVFVSEEYGHLIINPKMIFESPFCNVGGIDINRIEVGQK
ncbi:hypothetical protein [Cytobacillus purgationiresistens]|uniref:Metal-dependent hydrolase n=1 Tax=Cytobacillus purgationiresistens TaxID=863449 RepID=A0ABU0AQD0_9BACI|nr:hypothetical protein [Cytobacillus purgationiresistens]MDQ0273506.1 putative metal-dependent hydrolase [Cytobacillus purgationiresistens]